MRLLIIEDDPKILSFLKESLQSECYAVDTASDGNEGSYLARTNEYDLIILDNMLPKKSGSEVCQELRGLNIITPILVVSAQSEIDQKTTLLDFGADDYLTKPFQLPELLARIRAILRRPNLLQADILTIRDISLNIKSHTVHKNDQEIVLTRKEFMLLEYFMKHPDIVLTRGMILEHVWDMSVDIFSNTIESHILSLRKKLNDKIKSADPLIKTVPGRGYKIIS